MKNTTTAFLLFIFSMTGYYMTNEPHLFIGACIFASAYLIISQLEENNKK